MHRLALAPLVLLLAAPLPCRAADADTDASTKKGACVYARPAATGSQIAEADAPQARPAVPAAARSVPRATSGAGGGSDASEAVPGRTRARWHSFLPGMFR